MGRDEKQQYSDEVTCGVSRRTEPIKQSRANTVNISGLYQHIVGGHGAPQKITTEIGPVK